MSTTDADVAIVGGGPAGAALAMRLAAAGRHVVILERQPAWRWRAGGVFSSPATMAELRRLGVDQAALDRVARPIPRLWVTATGGTAFPLAYGGVGGSPGAIGFDRSTLDPLLLDLARAAGADVRVGAAVRSVALDAGRSTLALAGPAGHGVLTASTVVGADGIRSVVARAAGVARPARLGRRVGLTYHVRERATRPGDPARDGRMAVTAQGYVGLAPVPGGRINVGIVLWDRAALGDLARRGAAGTAAAILAALPETDVVPRPYTDATPLDPVSGAAPLGHRVTRRAGPGWMLIGDAAGFLDPFTGEGLHRALVSARLAADALLARRAVGAAVDLAGYDRRMRARFAAKDLVSGVVQAFLGRPALFDYAARRLADRDAVRERMGLVMGDLAPARNALDPRFLAALLAP